MSSTARRTVSNRDRLSRTSTRSVDVGIGSTRLDKFCQLRIGHHKKFKQQFAIEFVSRRDGGARFRTVLFGRVAHSSTSQQKLTGVVGRVKRNFLHA